MCDFIKNKDFLQDCIAAIIQFSALVNLTLNRPNFLTSVSSDCKKKKKKNLVKADDTGSKTILGFPWLGFLNFI